MFAPPAVTVQVTAAGGFLEDDVTGGGGNAEDDGTINFRISEAADLESFVRNDQGRIHFARQEYPEALEHFRDRPELAL